MRLVVWNCCSGFAKDLPALLELEPDVAVLPEAPAELPASPLGAPPISWASVGAYGHKALAVAGFGHDLVERPAPRSTGRWSVPVTVPSLDIGVLAIWATPASGGSADRYVLEVLAAVAAHRDWIAGGRVIVCGDFNADGLGTAERLKGAFTRLRAELEALGLASAYHVATGEAFGQETAPTYFHRRKPDVGFHIDFCFAPKEMAKSAKVEIGSFERWVGTGLSDHVPLVVDIDISERT